MVRTGPSLDHQPRPLRVARTPVRLIAILGIGWLVAIAVVTTLLAIGDPTSPGSQAIGSLAVLGALVFALVSCIAAARRRTAARTGWTLMAIGMGLGAVGQLGWVSSAFTAAEATPSAIGDTIAFLGYILPTLMAMFAFPRRSELLISRYRQILDVLVITLGVILISEASVLGSVIARTDTTTLAGWLHVAYLVGDIAICALVLCLGMRQLPGDRITWLFLGGGLLVVAISDSIYVRALTGGGEYLMSTPLAAGWMLGPVLIGLATYVPMTGRRSRGRDYTLLLQLLPYAPVVGALVLVFWRSGQWQPYFLVTAGLLVVVVMTRQVMIVYENVSLTRDLEGKVASRTAELTTLGSIVTSSTDAIVGISRDNRITAWNPAAEALYGRRAGEVMNQPPDFLLDRTGTATRELLERADRGDRLEGFEIDWTRPDGTSIPVAMTVSPIEGSDGVQGVSVFAQDITERRREAQALEQAREDALASSRLKSEFLATMSHEIRTPMNAVIGLTSLLLETELDPTQRMYTEGVNSAGDALLTVIDDILDFSKLEAGKVVLDQSDFSLRQLVDEVGALMAPAASGKGLELIAYCQPDVPAAVHGDAGRIRQILLNLVSNAVKFTATGEVILKVAMLSGDRDRSRLRFEVIDTGIGIAEKDQGRLFESFSQADASTTRRFGGTGLGLAISRRLVEVMGGRITLESEVDVGSTFAVEVTLRTASKLQPSADAFSDELLVGLRVLVVDDNSTNRTLLKTQLESWQMLPDVADTVARAFEMLRSSAMLGKPYDIAALDAHMPDTDGLELARRVTADPVLQGLPMIMLTSGLYPEPAAMRGLGITQWLPKPVRSADLFDRLVRLMAPREKELHARRSYLQDPQPPAAAGGTVLLVEDSLVSQVVIKQLVTDLGFQVHCVRDGAAALESLATAEFVAVLLAMDVPGTDGYEVARAVHELDRSGRRTPIIGLLTHVTTEERERCLAAGVERFLFRPVDAMAVAATVAELTPVRAVEQPQLWAEPEESPEDRVIDTSRLDDLAELVAADGTSLVVTMIDSYVRRSAERGESLQRAAADGDREAVISIAHELKGSSGTIGAQRVMRCASAIEQRVRKGDQPEAGAIAELLAEMDAAVRELTVRAGRAEEPEPPDLRPAPVSG
jgi:PAS domain S-box-containing protein